jgi:hypothetical protein
MSAEGAAVDSPDMEEPDDEVIVLAPGQRGWQKLIEVAEWTDDLDAPLTAERAFLEQRPQE